MMAMVMQAAEEAWRRAQPTHMQDQKRDRKP